MNNSKVQERMAELMEPINQQLMMCDDGNDQLMLASAMLITVKDIFEQRLGKNGRKLMFQDFV